MPRANQLLINTSNDEYTCLPCNREFDDEHAALQHVRNARTHDGEWCERCEWLFVSARARTDHIAASSGHNICQRCSLDFASVRRLEDHEVEIHHKCLTCGEEFQNENNLRQHQRTHLPRTEECYRCYRTFTSLSAMLIHLESGSCASGVTLRDVNDAAFNENRYGSEYEYTNDWNDYYMYRCPECGIKFRFVSALLQHVESSACEQEIDKGSVEDLVEAIKHHV